MLHKRRRFGVSEVQSAEELAKKLTEHSWTCCTGFAFSGLLFLNDATSPDGAQEYAVVNEDTLEQIESVTFGWMKRDEALEVIEVLVRRRSALTERVLPEGPVAVVKSAADLAIALGAQPFKFGRIENVLVPAREHGTCGHCA